MTVSTSTLFCIVCGREFRPRDADTVICPDCGGPPEAPAPSQPQGTVLADQPRGTVLMSQRPSKRRCLKRCKRLAAWRTFSAKRKPGWTWACTRTSSPATTSAAWEKCRASLPSAWRAGV
jgi:hypothetical protein